MVYNGGDVTSHNGRKWKAQYWTRGDEPGKAAVWVDQGAASCNRSAVMRKWGRPHFCLAAWWVSLPVGEKGVLVLSKGPSGPFSWYITGSAVLPQAEQQILLGASGPWWVKAWRCSPLARQPGDWSPECARAGPDPAPY